MKIEVYVDNMYIGTVEVETQEDADDAALETVKNWVENSYYYWTLAEED